MEKSKNPKKSRYAPYQQPFRKTYKYPVIPVPIVSDIVKKDIDNINNNNIRDNFSNMLKYKHTISLYIYTMMDILFNDNYNKHQLMKVIDDLKGNQNIQHLVRLKSIIESYKSSDDLHYTIKAILMNIGRPDNLEKKDTNVKIANTIYNNFLCALVRHALDDDKLRRLNNGEKEKIYEKIRDLVLAVEEEITGDFYQFQDINSLISSAKSNYERNTFIDKIFDRYSHVPSSYKYSVKNALFDASIEYKNKKYMGNSYIYEDGEVLGNNLITLKRGYELSKNELLKSGEQPIFCNSGYEMKDFEEFIYEFEGIQNNQDKMQNKLNEIKKGIDDGVMRSDELRLKYFIGCLMKRLYAANTGEKRTRLKEEINEFKEILIDLFNSNLEFNIWSYDNGDKICYKVKNTHISILCNFLISKLYQSGGNRKKKVKKSISTINKKIFTGPKGGMYYIVETNGKIIKKYVKK